MPLTQPKGGFMEKAQGLLNQSASSYSMQTKNTSSDPGKTVGGGVAAGMGGAAAGAATGAMIGSGGGPWGAAIGAVAGLAAYYLS